jgi:hypothetical protein
LRELHEAHKRARFNQHMPDNQEAKLNVDLDEVEDDSYRRCCYQWSTHITREQFWLSSIIRPPDTAYTSVERMTCAMCTLLGVTAYNALYFG